MKRCFVIEGPLYGYRASWSGSKNKFGRWKGGAHDPDWVAFKKRVRYLGDLHRIPAFIPNDEKLYFSCTIHWAKKQRLDWINVAKGIEDSLFAKDRRVFPGKFEALENQGEEFAEVECFWLYDENEGAT